MKNNMPGVAHERMLGKKKQCVIHQCSTFAQTSQRSTSQLDWESFPVTLTTSLAALAPGFPGTHQQGTVVIDLGS